MSWPPPQTALARVLTLLVWACVAGSALLWWLRSSGMGQGRAADVAGAATVGAVDAQLLARALGVAGDAAPAQDAAGDVATRVQLLGVITHDGQGAALLAVDGKPAKPVRLGHTPAGLDGWTLHSLSAHGAVLADIRDHARQVPLTMPKAMVSANAAATPPPQAAPLFVQQAAPDATPQPAHAPHNESGADLIR